VAIPVLLILAVLWAAVLVPPVLRSRSEHRRGGIGDYTSRLGALMGDHRDPSPPVSRRSDNRPLRPVPPLRSARSRSAVRSRRAMALARRRRRNVMVALVGVALVTFVLALLVNPLFWIAQVVADVLLVAYLSLLVLVKRHGLLGAGDNEFWSSTPDSRATTRVEHPRVPPRRELAPTQRTSRPRRSAAG